MEILAVYALITAALFYLGSRALITRWLWSRYPPGFAKFMDCAACSGFWYGLIVGAIDTWGIKVGPQVFGREWYAPVIVALCSVVWTPIVAGYMQLGFERLGSVVEDDGEAQ
ncbi:MAG: hypothetical protein ACREJC_12960 [Tepidisphaeraceae bacterium]